MPLNYILQISDSIRAIKDILEYGAQNKKETQDGFMAIVERQFEIFKEMYDQHIETYEKSKEIINEKSEEMIINGININAIKLKEYFEEKAFYKKDAETMAIFFEQMKSYSKLIEQNDKIRIDIKESVLNKYKQYLNLMAKSFDVDKELLGEPFEPHVVRMYNELSGYITLYGVNGNKQEMIDNINKSIIKLRQIYGEADVIISFIRANL